MAFTKNVTFQSPVQSVASANMEVESHRRGDNPSLGRRALRQVRQNAYSFIGHYESFDLRKLSAFVFDNGFGSFSDHFKKHINNSDYLLCLFAVAAIHYHGKRGRYENPGLDAVITAEKNRQIGPIRTGCAVSSERQHEDSRNRLLLDLILALIAYSHYEYCFSFGCIELKLAYWMFRKYGHVEEDYDAFLRDVTESMQKGRQLPDASRYISPKTRSELDYVKVIAEGTLQRSYPSILTHKQRMEEFHRQRWEQVRLPRRPKRRHSFH